MSLSTTVGTTPAAAAAAAVAAAMGAPAGTPAAARAAVRMEAAMAGESCSHGGSVSVVCAAGEAAGVAEGSMVMGGSHVDCMPDGPGASGAGDGPAGIWVAWPAEVPAEPATVVVWWRTGVGPRRRSYHTSGASKRADG